MLFSHVHLGRIAAEFVAAYPRVLLEVTVENRLVDVVEEGYDLVIRANPQPTDELVGRCFLRDKLLIVAPPSVDRPAFDDVDAAVPAVVVSAGPNEAFWRYRTGSASAGAAPGFAAHGPRGYVRGGWRGIVACVHGASEVGRRNLVVLGGVGRTAGGDLRPAHVAAVGEQRGSGVPGLSFKRIPVTGIAEATRTRQIEGLAHAFWTG